MPTPIVAAPNEITRAGLAVPTEITGDATNGHSITGNDGNVFLLVHNTSGTVTRTLTVAVSATVDGQTVASRAYPLALGISRYVGPFPTSIYGSTLSITVDNAEMHFTPFHLPGF